MDAHAARKARQYFEEEEIHVAHGLRDVRRIDEEEVPGPEALEFVERHVLDLLHQQSIDPETGIAQERTRIRLDARDLAPAAEKAPLHIGHQQRRVTRADLHD